MKDSDYLESNKSENEEFIDISLNIDSLFEDIESQDEELSKNEVRYGITRNIKKN